MKKLVILTSIALGVSIANSFACAPTGPYYNYINPECPDLVLDWKAQTLSSTMGISSYDVNGGSYVNVLDSNNSSNNTNSIAYQSDEDSTITFSFTASQTMSLEGVQINDYFTTEANSPIWDQFGARLYINGVQVATTGSKVAQNTVIGAPLYDNFQGYTVQSDMFWDFSAAGYIVDAVGGFTVNSGDTFSLDFVNLLEDFDTGDVHEGDMLNLRELKIHGCVEPVPEPSSALLSALAGLVLLGRRRR